MIGDVSKEELGVLTLLVDGYIRTSHPGYRVGIEKNKERLGHAVTQCRQYLNNLESTGAENGLKPYAEKFLKSVKKLVKLTKGQKKMGVLPEMDIFSSPYPVKGQLEGKS